MMHGIASFLLFSLAGPALASAPPLDHKTMFQLWEKAKAPLSGEPEAIGSYSAGCLAGAEKLPLDGPGYAVMRPSRLRYFGHPELLRFIGDLGQSAKKSGLPLLLIGDLGRPRGGPMASGHASHQIGLDVDIWYNLSHKRPKKKERETWGADSFVDKNNGMKRAWGQKQRRLLALAAERPEVDRIFVNAAIKRDLCAASPDAPWLYKLRPWWGHADHLHVRLRCPEGSAHCEAQETLDPSKPQCGEELAWWFSPEAKEEWSKKKVSIGRVFPELPNGCERMVREFHARSASQP